MESSEVRKRVREAIERASHGAAARRALNDAASRAWDAGREAIVLPAWQQVMQVLRSEGYLFQISAPSQAVRVTSERAAQDGVELALDTSGPAPVLLLTVTRSRGRDVMREERVALSGVDAIAALSDEQACAILLEALAPFLER